MFPVRPFLFALATVLLAGCGVNPNGTGYDAYGNPIDPYSTAYGGSYGSDYSSGGSSYSSDYSSGSSYGSDYSSGSSYSSDYGSTGTTGGSYGDYGSAYGDDSVINKNSTTGTKAQAPVVLDAPALSAWVTDVKAPGLWGRLTGTKVTVKVEVENPSNRSLTGKLKVTFLKNGDPSGVQQIRTLTLAPKEKQLLTFTASNSSLNDAEASIETEAPKSGGTSGSTTNGGVVVDRVVKDKDSTKYGY